jgi:hypothetical protein
MEHDLSLGAREAIASPILLMESTGQRPVLEMRYLQVCALQSHGMVLDGSREVKEPINSHIHPMVSTGLRPLLGMAFSQQPVKPWLGTAPYGWLEAEEQYIKSHIHPMVKHGLGQLLEVRSLQLYATHSHTAAL